jgi:predicted component of type VI protein secretion system
MITLRLFNAREPGQQLDARTLESGEISIGRDRSQDWVLDDPGRLLSRSHLVVTVRNGGVLVTDKSANGVTLVDRDERLPQGRATPISLGSTLRFGPFLLVVERAAAAAATSVSRDPPASPFTSGAGARDEAPSRSPNPFSSALPADALSMHSASTRPLLSLNPVGAAGLSEPASDDVWERAPQRRAGDWEAPAPRRESHEGLIGSGQVWRDPHPEPPKDVGFGFDAPFTQPMLRKVDVSGIDLAIPSDWDQPTNGRDRGEPLRNTRRDEPLARVTDHDLGPTIRPGVDPLAVELASRDRAARENAPSPDALIDARPPSPFIPSQSQGGPTAPDAPAAVARAPVPAPRTDADAALMAAFFRGAKLDPNLFAHADSAEVMERLGVVYRHMILGMSDLLSERTSLKNEYRMVRTTVRAENNNPFKWAPPQKVASQLLLDREDGFISGPDAVQDAFKDLKKHLLCLLAGLRAAISSTLEALSPAHIEAQIKGQNLIMKNRGSAAWAEYSKNYAEFCKQADDNPDSLINREFRSAYERQLTELDSMTPR